METKVISLKLAYDLLNISVAVILDDAVVIYPALDKLTGEPDNEFLYLSWENSNGQEFDCRFIEENNQSVTEDNTSSSIWLEDTEGDRVKITLLQKMKLTI